MAARHQVCLDKDEAKRNDSQTEIAAHRDQPETAGLSISQTTIYHELLSIINMNGRGLHLDEARTPYKFDILTLRASVSRCDEPNE
jgi:hypothetical protein